jgi:hypothetical protein
VADVLAEPPALLSTDVSDIELARLGKLLVDLVDGRGQVLNRLRRAPSPRRIDEGPTFTFGHLDAIPQLAGVGRAKRNRAEGGFVMKNSSLELSVAHMSQGMRHC